MDWAAFIKDFIVVGSQVAFVTFGSVVLSYGFYDRYFRKKK